MSKTDYPKVHSDFHLSSLSMFRSRTTLFVHIHWGCYTTTVITYVNEKSQSPRMSKIFLLQYSPFNFYEWTVYNREIKKILQFTLFVK